ncbi:hypothetical protein GOP47_0028959 [Adiantum capillus-veneris]|nr:hypothetical protein GOP47_0028959 [Adiantum capillus-veneris]
MALLGSCKIHEDVPLAEYAADAILKLEPGNASVYVLLSNIYAASGLHKKRENLQKLMLERGIKRKQGRSYIEVNGEVHEFVCGDKGHPWTEEIYKRLNSLVEEMKAAGYKPDRLSVFQPMDDNEMEGILCNHSEKLAIAFGLISTPPKTTLHIANNLRVCVDCHNATKCISRIVERKIIVRDANCIHCFKDGVCSCQDMW